MNVHELHNMLVQEKSRLKNKGNRSIHYVNNYGSRKKVNKKIWKEKKTIKYQQVLY